MMTEKDRGWKRVKTGFFGRPRLNKGALSRLNWEHMETQGGSDVVKGVSHRVIVVKSPDKYFEEAILVIRDYVLLSNGSSKECVLKEARRAADAYVAGRSKKMNSVLFKLPAPLFAAAGAAAAGLTWLAVHLCGV